MISKTRLSLQEFVNLKVRPITHNGYDRWELSGSKNKSKKVWVKSMGNIASFMQNFASLSIEDFNFYPGEKGIFSLTY